MNYGEPNKVCAMGLMLDREAERTKREMIEDGKTFNLYLVERDGSYFIEDWFGKLSFPVLDIKKGRHNFCKRRYDFHFTGPDNKRWYGVNYGDNTMIAHCKRLKK